jgi:hypothetical protein
MSLYQQPSWVPYIGNGSLRQYAVPFPYIDRSHVFVEANGVSLPFTWVNSALIELVTAPALGVQFIVERRTPSANPLVDFEPGAALQDEDLDIVTNQSLFVAQEAADSVRGLVGLYLGEKTVLPTVNNQGFPLIDGALVSLTGQTPASLNGVYVRRNGVWVMSVSPLQGDFRTFRFVATASQTVFTGADANGEPLSYRPNAVIVTVNGSSLAPTAYNVSSGTSVVFSTGLTAGDVVVIHSFGSFSVASAEGAAFTPAGAGAAVRTIQTKLRESVSLEDYYLTTDLGAMQNAFSRALATGAKRINVGSDNYSLSDTVPILRDNVSIVGPGDGMGSINMTGSSAIMFDVGSAAARVFHVTIDNLVLSRTTLTAASIVARVRNANYFKCRNNRFFMDNKWGSALDIQHGSYHDYKDNRFEDSIDATVTMGGGTGGGGALNGWLVGHRWERCVFDGANASKGSPSTQATVIMNDHVSAVWFRDCEAYSHLGYAWDLRGTFANRARNVLNLWWNPNVEATLGSSAAIRMDGAQGNRIEGGWTSGKDIAPIAFGVDAAANVVQGLTVGFEGATDGISDAGDYNSYLGLDLIGYGGGSQAGLRFASTASNGNVSGGTIIQCVNAVVSASGTAGRHNISGLTTRSISGDVFSGFTVTDKVSGYLNQDADTFFTRTGATLNLPFGVSNSIISVAGSAGDIDSFRAGLYHREELKILCSSAHTIRDLTVSGGNLLLPSAASIVVTAGRGVYVFSWSANDARWEMHV